MYTEADWNDFVHIGPGTLAGRYLRLFWQPVYRSQDLKAGQAVPLKIMSEEFTLYRGGGETPHALAFRCAHRGTQLSTGWVEEDNLRCFYHGWTYDPSGQCVEQPAEPEPFCNRIRIRSYPVQEYLGLIFVYMGEGAAPPRQHLPEFDGEGVLVAHPLTPWPCNYFNRVENALDPVHLAFAHRESSFSENGLVGIPDVSGTETEYGIETRATRTNEGTRINHFLMPNCFRSTQYDRHGGWGERVSWYVPIDDDHYVIVGATLFPVTGEKTEGFKGSLHERPARERSIPELGDAVLAGQTSLDQITDRSILVQIQDYVAQVGQGAIPDREQEHSGQSDALVMLLRNIWRRELRKLAEGAPIKRWVRKEPLRAVVGV